MAEKKEKKKTCDVLPCLVCTACPAVGKIWLTFRANFRADFTDLKANITTLERFKAELLYPLANRLAAEIPLLFLDASTGAAFYRRSVRLMSGEKALSQTLAACMPTVLPQTHNHRPNPDST